MAEQFTDTSLVGCSARPKFHLIRGCDYAYEPASTAVIYDYWRSLSTTTRESQNTLETESKEKRRPEMP